MFQLEHFVYFSNAQRCSTWNIPALRKLDRLENVGKAELKTKRWEASFMLALLK